jgi:hypothetical protein
MAASRKGPKGQKGSKKNRAAEGMIRRLDGVIFAALVYIAMWAAMAASAAFLSGGWVRWVGSPDSRPVRRPAETLVALITDSLLLIVVLGCCFALERPEVRAGVVRRVTAYGERSLAVLVTSAGLALVMWLWEPIPFPIFWKIEDPQWREWLRYAYWGGWGLLVLGMLATRHLETVGFRQAFLHLRGERLRDEDAMPAAAVRSVFHPSLIGLLVLLWAAPEMSAGRLMLSASLTVYAILTALLAAVDAEERRLAAEENERYSSVKMVALAAGSTAQAPSAPTSSVPSASAATPAVIATAPPPNNPAVVLPGTVAPADGAVPLPQPPSVPYMPVAATQPPAVLPPAEPPPPLLPSTPPTAKFDPKSRKRVRWRYR